jgi:hypothetical protein
MNYLSHYFIDSKPDEHYYNAALILPDITKPWIKTFRTPEPPPSFSQNQLALLQGALRHYHSDKLFHASAFFDHYQNLLNQYLKEVPFSEALNRKWFIAHVLTELLIDRQIVLTRPKVVDGFYSSLATINDDELAVMLEYYGMHEKADFFRFFNHFRSAQYIYYYADNNKFLYSLSRIMLRVGLKEPGERDNELLLEAILTIEQKYMSNPTKLLDELKAVFI